MTNVSIYVSINYCVFVQIKNETMCFGAHVDCALLFCADTEKYLRTVKRAHTAATWAYVLP